MTIHKKGDYLPIILFVFFSSSLSAFSPIRDYYIINNTSGEDLFLTVRHYDDAWRSVHILGERNKKLFRQDERLYPYRNSLTLFDCRPELRIEIGPDGVYNNIFNETRSPEETLKRFIRELILYDREGNIVLTLDDIQEGHFEYTDPERRLSPCIMVTPEMVQAGREKYALYE